MQNYGLTEYVGVVSQPTGIESEPTSLCQGLAREQERGVALPISTGSAGMKPTCAASVRGLIVVRDGESPLHGEGDQESSRNYTLGDDTPALERGILQVSELQKRLAEKATAEPEHRFGGLYALLTRETVLEEAATRLLGNKGSRTPGLDGIARDKIRRNYEYHAELLRQQLLDGTFQPTPCKRVYIPKKNGKMRPLGIPTIYDRWVQMALKIILEPIFESDFQNFSHGFRPNRSCLTAAAHIHRLTIQPRRKVYWVIEGDIKGFFDHVHHKKLMTLLRERIRDKDVLDLIWRFLKAGVMEGVLFKKTEEGTPQGGVLSPLLANIYLNHFDRWIAKQAMLGDHPSRRDRNRKAGHANYMMVRYADDFVVFSNGTKEETEAFKAKIKEFLADDLKLELSEEKTKTTHYHDGFDFLGFTFRKVIAQTGKNREVVVHYPSTASVQRAARKVAEITDRRYILKSPEEQIEALNAFLRGWGEYFRHSSSKAALRYIGSRAFMNMWKWLMEKQGKHHGWREVKAKYHKDNTWHAGKQTMFILQSMKVEYPVCRAIPNPYLTEQRVTEPHHYDPFLNEWTGVNSYGANWREERDKARETTGGKCAICGDAVNVEINHITPKAQGGGNVQTNLIPLCRTHHRQAERRNSSVSHSLRDIKRKLDSGEPDEAKVSRPVREEGLQKPA